MEQEKFENLVQEAINSIDEKFLQALENVAIVIEEEATDQQKQKSGIGKNAVLFGLYEGVPKTHRGPNYGMTLPDKISIFQKPIEEVAGSEDKIKELVRNVVCHEIAHHFGSDERGAQKSEKKNKKKN